MSDRLIVRFISGVLLSGWVSIVASSAGASDAVDWRRSPRSLVSAQFHDASISEPRPAQTSVQRVVQLGDRGRIVAQIQLMLEALGVYDGALDGRYDSETARAVTAFQRSRRLVATGHVDRITWNQLRLDFDRVRAGEMPAEHSAFELQANGSQPQANDADQPKESQIDATLDSNSSLPPSASTPSDSSDLLKAAPQSTPGSFESGSSTTGSSTIEESQPNASAEEPVSSHLPWLQFGVLSLAIAIVFYSLGRMNRPARQRLARAHNRRLTQENSAPENSEGQSASASAECDRSASASTPNASALSLATPSLPLESQSSGPPASTEPVVAIELDSTTRIPHLKKPHIHLESLDSLDPATRRKAIWQLGQTGTTDAIQPLVNLMLKVDSQQRSLILAAISEIGVRTLKPLSSALMTSMQDDSSDVRKNAIRDITRLYQLLGQVTSVLRHATHDSDDEVRQTACWALDQLHSLRLNSPLATALPAASKTNPSNGLAITSADADMSAHHDLS